MRNAITFGQLVKEHRSALGLTQAELARRAGCAPITIRKIEADDLRPSVQLAELLALALAIPEAEQLAFVRLGRQQPDLPPIPTPSPSANEIGMDDLTGRAVKGFQLGERIGSGGFGVVYQALQPSVQREVAVKIILPRYANHPDFIRRFEAEAHLVARLEHPHIVPLYDYWREPDAAYLIMRLLRGGSLEDLVKNGVLTLDLILQVAKQVGTALDVAHRAGVVHRDVKPANVLLDEDQNAYLADFGIAKNLEQVHQDSLTAGGAIVGSPAYISPEQIKAEPVRPQSDIYCFGIMLFEMLTGSKPFAGSTPVAYIQQHLNDQPPSLSQFNTSLPASLDGIIQRATAKSLEDRYPSVTALLRDLEQAFPQTMVIPIGNGAVNGDAATAETRLDTAELAALENPYRGLRAFTEADADNFFGRETFVQELLGLMSDGADLERFVAVVGPSGGGKSSVVKAGVIPTLRRGGLPNSENWFVVDMTPGTHPWEEAEAALLRVAVNPPDSLLAQLRDGPRGLLRAVQRILPADDETELVLIIDQFEELFTLVDDEAVRGQFLEGLVTAVLDPRSRLRVIVTMRADFTDRPLNYIDFGELMRQRTVFILPLTPDELTQAITRPVEQLGLQMEPRLVSTITAEVGQQPGMLPLLQYALTELFEHREGRMITLKAYHATGGVTGALARRADEIFGGLNPAAQMAARQMFLRLITLGEGVEDTRRRVNQTELFQLGSAGGNQALMPMVLETFGKHRLLTFDHDPVTRVPTAEVAHEALLREWPRLRQWLTDSRDDVRQQRLLAEAARLWEGSGRDKSYLLIGSRLANFEVWVERTTVILTADEQAFLEASLMAREKQTREEELRRQRELETAERLAEEQAQRAEEAEHATKQLRWRRNVASAVASVAGILSVVAIFFFLQASQNEQMAQRQTAIAQTQSMLAWSSLLIAGGDSPSITQTTKSLLMGVQAIKNNEALDADIDQSLGHAQLHNMLDRNFRPSLITVLEGHTEEVHFVEFSDDGQMLVSVGPDGTVRLWDLTNLLAEPIVLERGTGVAEAVAFAPDGETLLTTDGLIILKWDLSDLSVDPVIFNNEIKGGYGLVFSPDGQTLATFDDFSDVLLWDYQNPGNPPIKLKGHTAFGLDLSFAPDGQALASSSVDGTVRVWDMTNLSADAVVLEDPNVEQSLSPFPAVRAVEFSPDGSVLASAGPDGKVRLWDMTDLSALPIALGGHSDSIRYVDFSPDGSMLVSGSDDKTLRLWDMTHPFYESTVLTGHSDFVLGGAFSPDGKTFASGSLDKTIHLWDVSSAKPTILTEHDEAVFSVGFSPDGQTVASADGDGQIKLWPVADPTSSITLEGHISDVRAVAFSPNGRTLASASEDKTVRLWDTENLSADPVILEGHDEFVLSVAFAPDGQTLASAGEDKIIYLWDVLNIEADPTILQGHTGFVQAVSFSPDGQTIASASTDRTIRLWDVTNLSNAPRVLEGHESSVTSVAFAPDDQILASASADTTIRLWNLADPSDEPITLIGHLDTVFSVAFSPDGNTLFSTGFDRTIRMWDMNDLAKPPIILDGHTDWIRSVTVSPDGNMLASASGDQTVRLWPTLDGLIDSACEKADRNMIWGEWNDYLAGQPYERTCPQYPAHSSVPDNEEQ